MKIYIVKEEVVNTEVDEVYEQDVSFYTTILKARDKLIEIKKANEKYLFKDTETLQYKQSLDCSKCGASNKFKRIVKYYIKEVEVIE